MHPSTGPQPDPLTTTELWSHPKLPVIHQVAIRGICDWTRPDDAPVRPGEPCGLIHTRCTAHKKASRGTRREQRGDPCGNPAPAGLTVCVKHGANAGQTRRIHDDHLAMNSAMAACQTLGLPVDVDPFDALYQELCRTNGHVLWLAAEIAKLDPDQLTWGLHDHRKGEGPEGPVDVETHRAGPPVLLELYERERAHLVKVSAECVKAGIADRFMRLAEEAGQRDARLLEVFAAELGVDLQAPDTRRAVERVFRVIDGGQAA